MQRYMRQGTFDSFVILRAMIDLTGDDQIFRELIKQYVVMYPSEHAQALLEDVNDATVSAWKITQMIVQLRESPPDQDTSARLYSVLEQLRDIMRKNDEQHGPSRMMPDGSLFNSSRTPLPDRIATCREHLALAGQQLLSGSAKER